MVAKSDTHAAPLLSRKSLRPSVTVIIPALNEATNLPFVLPRIPKEWVDEIILVDGFSIDDTVEVARRCIPDIRILMQQGQGKGAALRTGFKAATGRIVIMLDADGSTDPREIPLFVAALMCGADFVKGSRFLQGGGTFDMPQYRAFGNYALTQLTNLLFGTKYTDITYGYNAAWKYCSSAMAFEIDGWANEILSNIRVARSGLRVVEVPCFEYKRVAGMAKLQTFSAGWVILKGIVRERFRKTHWTIWENRDVIGDTEFTPAMQLLRTEALHLMETKSLSPEARATAIEALQHSYRQVLALKTEHEDAQRLQSQCRQYNTSMAPIWHLLQNNSRHDSGVPFASEATVSVSIIIRTYSHERWAYLVKAVESCMAQDLKPEEIIIVVDNNPELAASVREKWQDETLLHVVENIGTSGSSAAWNAGVREARGDILAFLDDDAVAARDWSKNLCQHYARSDVLAVGGQILPMWESGRPQWFPDEFLWVVGCSYRGLPDSTASVRNLIGCNMSFRRSVFEEIGAFRTDLGHQGKRPSGNEETELCIRARQMWPEKLILHEPGAHVDHVVTSARATWRYFIWRCTLEGRSKALLSGMVGTGDSLSSEMAYTLRILPSGFMKGIWQAIKGDSGGLKRSMAIFIGFGCVLRSYLVNRIFARR